MSNDRLIWDYFFDKFKNPYAVAGLMGNLFAESSLNPILANGVKKYGISSAQYTLAVDESKNDNFITDGIAYGLAQWCYHTRKRGLLLKARAEKKSIGDIHLQLDYLWSELQSYKTVLNTLYGAKSVKEASDVVLLKYEKPANTSEAVRNKRTSYGEKYYNKYVISNTVKAKIRVSTAKQLKTELERKLL